VPRAHSRTCRRTDALDSRSDCRRADRARPVAGARSDGRGAAQGRRRPGRRRTRMGARYPRSARAARRGRPARRRRALRRGDAPAAPAERRPDCCRPPRPARSLEHGARDSGHAGAARSGASRLRGDRRTRRAQPVRAAQPFGRRLARGPSRLRGLRTCGAPRSAGTGMSRGASPFSPRAILAVLVVGAAAFLLFLYAIGAGWTGREDQNGGAHAAANGLNGFAGLVRLLEAQGHEVELSRSKTRLQDEGLLVLTPPIYADGERIAEVIRARRYDGPTLVILPKWPAMEASGIPGVDARRGWVLLGSPVAPRWIDELEGLGDAEIAIGERRRWEGMGLAGTFPEPDK